jgi:hypothetical protein
VLVGGAAVRNAHGAALPRCNAAPFFVCATRRAAFASRWKAVCFPLRATARQRASIDRVVEPVFAFTIPENP